MAGHKLLPQAGRKTMVVISDGVDHGSRVNLETASRSAQMADAVVYAIHYEDKEGGGEGVLRKLSRPTGGRIFQVGEGMPLERIFGVIGEEMRSQYGIGFRPSHGGNDGRFHRLEVKALAPGLTVQARTGYYAVGK